MPYYKQIYPGSTTSALAEAAVPEDNNAPDSQLNELTERDKSAIQATFKLYGIESPDELAEWLMIKNNCEPEVLN